MSFGDAHHPFQLDQRLKRRADVLFGLAKRYHAYRVIGLDQLPPPPFILAVNHSLATYDTALLGHTILERRNILVRGLGDRLIFRLPVVDEVAHRAGVVEARPDNAEALLRDGHALLVAPGGMREALRSSANRYRTLWQTRKGFARLSLATGAPIVLAACPRADDLYRVPRITLTERLYENYRIPVSVPLGSLGSLVPRPVRLTHHLSEPLAPAPNETLEAFHARVVDRMDELMDDALLASYRGA